MTVSLGSVPMQRYSFETLELLRQAAVEWEFELNRENTRSEKMDGAIVTGSRLKFYVIEVCLEFLPEGSERSYLEHLPTSFNLPRAATKRLRNAAATLLTQSADFQRLLEDIRTGQ